MSFGFSSSSKFVVSVCVLSGVGLCGLLACAPDPVARVYNVPNQEFGPKRTDGILDLSKVQAKALPTAKNFEWNGEIETATWHRTIDDLTYLARRRDEPRLGQLAFQMRDAIRSNGIAWESTVSASAYTSAAIGETKADTKKLLDEAVEMLAAQEPILTGILAARSQATAWPQQPVRLTELVDHIQGFLKGFVVDVEASDADPAVKKEVVSELRINFGPRLERIKKQIEAAYHEDKVYNFVLRTRKAVEDEGIDLGKATHDKLVQAENLPRQTERIKDARSALSVIVDFWRAASPEVRSTKFKEASADLYDFLDGKTEHELDCIKSSCDIFNKIAKSLFILPKIEEFGIGKIKKTLLAASQEFIIREIEAQAVAALPTLHQEIGLRIAAELKQQRDNLGAIEKDYPTYIRTVLNRMSLAKLGLREKDAFSGIEPVRVTAEINIMGTGATSPGIRLKRLTTPNGSQFMTGGEAIGTSISSSLEVYENSAARELQNLGFGQVQIQQSLGRIFFEQINKVLLVGGFKTEAAKSFESLSIALDSDMTSRKRLNLRNLMGSPLSFAVPDLLSVGRPAKPELVMTSVPQLPLVVGVAGQAELLRGFSRLASRLRDWETTSFDPVLGAVNLADFVPDLPREAVDQKLFPKDLLFAASVGNAAVILQNITKKSSSVGLIDPDKKLRWANEKSETALKASQQPTMATVFDVTGSERSKISKVADVARFLSGLIEFLKATEGIENTQSPALLDPDAKGQRPVDMLIAARADLKLLVMAMANFLSSEVVGKDGLVRPLYDRVSKLPVGAPRLIEQALVIRALLDASDAISADIYKTAAIDLMAAVNQSFFKPSLAFYSLNVNGEERPDMDTILSMLVAGDRVAPFLSSDRARQWKLVAAPWYSALEDAADRLTNTVQ